MKPDGNEVSRYCLTKASLFNIVVGSPRTANVDRLRTLQEGFVALNDNPDSSLMDFGLLSSQSAGFAPKRKDVSTETRSVH